MKYNYPPLQEPCKSCIYKCFRVEDINFISDPNCKYAEKPREKIKEIKGEQMKI